MLYRGVCRESNRNHSAVPVGQRLADYNPDERKPLPSGVGSRHFAASNSSFSRFT